ncbi:DUF5606 family protein [Sediminitomix flava]|uniref:Uncharacterized protein n=1 Tax=Sediminitomix flava TaxID=379075 RepID=A0A315ZGC0_SEDFL|nr:DUF5606 domain-containing protein [Sediminitomix flava]PWJ43908.1 hypothetical protein BC781_101258 [Sediminitomix flava]
MNLKDVAAIAGKPGIFKILKPTRNGVIVETIAEKKMKSVVNATQRISVLKEISVYVEGEAEESVPLEDVFGLMKKACEGAKADVNTSDADELADFLASILPAYDRDRVYTSDIKKLVNWYNLLVTYYPEALEAAEEEEDSEEAAE